MKLQNWINWHRTAGFIATLFILMLAVTGVLLNHTDDFKLDEIYIDNETILDWYGIAPESAPVSYQSDGHWLTQIDNRLYLDDAEITGNPDQLQGVVTSMDIFILAFTHGLYLITQGGDLIEKITGRQNIPENIQGIGLGPAGGIIIRSSGSEFYTDQDMQTWSPYRKADSNWSVSEQPPSAMEKKLLHMYRGRGLTLEKLLVDLHSGRILGRIGVYLIDLVGIIFIILAFSGWCVWMKRRSIQNQINGKLK